MVRVVVGTLRIAGVFEIWVVEGVDVWIGVYCTVCAVWPDGAMQPVQDRASTRMSKVIAA